MSAPADGLLDTSTVVLLNRLTDPTLLPTRPTISTITLAELSVGPLVAGSDEERAARQAHVQQAEADFDPIPFDAAAAQRVRSGRSQPARGRTQANCSRSDALIAAVAVAHDLPLYTVNPDDFVGIDDLAVRPVPHPDRRG